MCIIDQSPATRIGDFEYGPGHVLPLGATLMFVMTTDAEEDLDRFIRYRRIMKTESDEQGIVALPTQLFYSTGIPVSLWFLNKNKKQPGRTLFIDARKLGTMVTRRLRELTEEDILRMAGTYQAFCQGILCAASSVNKNFELCG